MEEDTEYKKLPIDERCVHKLWKARVDGYEEATKLFREIDDEKSPEWNKFLGLIKKFVNDSNAMAQEKGLEATLIFVENCGHAGKTVGEVIAGIVGKCIAAPKAKTKDLAVQIALLYIEIEKHDAVIEELLKGIDHKNPKISSGCTAIITLALKEFGIKVINVKPIIKKIPVLLTDRDKTVRDEGKLLTIEIFRWIGPALKPQLASLAPVLVTELENEFEKLKGGKALPTRYLRSQQEKQIAVAAAQAEECDDVEEGNVDQEEMDPMDLIDPVDILSKLPKDFFEKIEAKKWQDRKEALDALELLLQNPKLESGDYGDLIRALKKVLSKDTNVVLVALAGKCMANVAKGIGKKFQIYSSACIPAILEKFKEKKPNVVSALREAIDAIYPSTNLDTMQEDILEALNNKNPSVKAETTSFLARAFTKTIPTVFNKKLLKVYVTALLKTLNEPDPTVRDNSAEALGTAMKLVGDKAIAPYLSEVDALKMVKIKECCDKAVIVVKIPGIKKERPATAPVKNPTIQKAGSTQPKPVKRPATAAIGNKKPATKKATGGALAKSASTAKVLPTERDMGSEEIDEKSAEILPPDVISGLSDSNWKTRLAAMESFCNVINGLEDNCGHSQVLIRTLVKKPGLKDTNFQVLKSKLDIIKIIVEKMGITVTTADYIITDVTEKLGDAKNSLLACQALIAIAEAIRLDYVVSKVMDYAFEQKSPKVQQESLIWVNTAIREFGFQVNPKVLLDDVKKAVQITNPIVRAAGIVLIGTMYLYMGNTLLMFFDNEKPALKQQIQTECDKNSDQKPPVPFRGVKNGVSKESLDDDDEGENEQMQINVADLLPRIDIGPQITEALLTEMSDKNWKTRNEGLTKLQAILNDAKLIKPTIGDLAQALSQRLVDSNAKIAQTSLAICQQLATSMGPPCRQHVRALFPGFLHGLGDNKSFIRTASITCINIWGDQCGYKEFFESEMIADALKIGGPALRTELWGWLAEKLPALPPKSFQKEELVICLPYLYANICDRNADVRKNANEAILGIMIHLGFDCMVKALDKQKPTSKKDIQAALEKARPNLPLKPLPKNKQQAPIIEDKPTRNGGASGIGKPRPASAANSKTAAPAASRNKKEEEVDTSPLLATNNTKNQRLLDEQKLRVLKWTFTQPREEFIELLREQMVTANVNRGLLANMFHDDFRYHLKAIEALIEDLPNNEKALISNLDLILKWVSLRFYDTNPSVLLKGLDYLNQVFTMLTEISYDLAENEGNSFIPHLLIKIGDPKDAVRNGVRQIIRQICLIFPITKTFAFVMEGLKSKNARQRTECLDELGYLIGNYGIVVCQPTPQVALKEIARHISDRDNSVRSAALNCIVQGYFLAGDKIYKLIGQMTEKDLSMLDERIKRAKRPKKTEQPNATSVSPSQDNIDVQEIVQEEEELPSEEMSPMVTRQFVEPIPQQKPSGPFRLDPDVVAEIEKDWLKSDQIKEGEIQKVDISFLYSPLRVISRDGICYPKDKFEKLISNPPSMPYTNNNSSVSPSQMHYNNYTMSPTNPTSVNNAVKQTNLADSLPKLDQNLLRIILAIGNKDTIVARAAINELNDILESTEKQAVLRDYEETYIQSVLQQFKNLSQHSFSDSLNDSLIMYQQLLASTLTFFNSKHLGKNLSISSLKNIMSVLLGLMADHKLANGDYTKVINGICLKILDRTNFTNLNCALIRLLKETCSSAGLPKFTDLLMKCIWRNVKVMPERSNDLNYDDVLLEVHEFMLALPSSWWQQRPSDTPLRTVKTIIHNMTKIKGTAILQHLNKIPTHSELHAYLIRILKNIQKDASSNANQMNNPGSSPQQQTNLPQIKESKRMTKQTHEAMSQIFKLISDKETSKEGLLKLYQFKIDNPEVDIVPFLRGASPCFQKFIEDGLAEIESQQIHKDGRNDNKTDDNINTITGNRVMTSNNFKDAEYYIDKLNSFREKGNLPSACINKDYKQVMDNKMADENLNMNQMPIKSLLINKEKIPDLSANRRELLQQKLAQIKKSSH